MSGTSRTGRSGAHAAGEPQQDATYAWLKQWIATLPRNTGTFITEAEVSEAAKTGRTPAREALLRMEAEGFLEIRPRKGAFIPPISDAEIDDVMQARILVEEWAVRRISTATADMRNDVAHQLDLVLAEQRDLVDNPADFIERDRMFHRILVRAAGNAVLADFYELLRDRQMRMGLLALAARSDRQQTVLEEHVTITTAIRRGDPEGAGRAVVEHLEQTLEVLRLPAPLAWQPLAARSSPSE